MFRLKKQRPSWRSETGEIASARRLRLRRPRTPFSLKLRACRSTRSLNTCLKLSSPEARLYRVTSDAWGRLGELLDLLSDIDIKSRSGEILKGKLAGARIRNPYPRYCDFRVDLVRSEERRVGKECR